MKRLLTSIAILIILLTGCTNKNTNNDYKIVDKTLEMNDFSCASVLERFYEDDKYAYSYSCMKSEYIVVQYNDGSEETVSEALKNGKIKIEDLDRFDIKYYKSEK